VAVIVANGLLPDDVAAWVTSVLAALAAALVYFVPNGENPQDGVVGLEQATVERPGDPVGY
jgi:hypothetical protein